MKIYHSLLLSLSLFFLFSLVRGDAFFHNPRGSNNRLGETTADRRNAQRLFDSMNNGRGGYSWGPAMQYVEGSILTLEWTANHMCTNGQTSCTEVLQYMCTSAADGDNIIRDGSTTGVPYTITLSSSGPSERDFDGNFTYGLHESFEYYNQCARRQRNGGLFTANSPMEPFATSTRASRGVNRAGFECPEEKEYYPYWHPSPWKDIVVLTTDTSKCPLYQSESQNVKPKNFCILDNSTSVPNNEINCVRFGGQWTSSPAHGLTAPQCIPSSSASQYQEDQAIPGDVRRYTWTLPTRQTEACTSSKCNCVLRVRYNVSSAETDQYVDDRSNTLFRSDPNLEVDGMVFQIKQDSTTTSRVYQDRTHMFNIVPRSDSIPLSTKIYNINVAGKRGSYVEVFPAMEYNFSPANLNVNIGDMVHFQWTGSNYNVDSVQGEGLVRTDRSNVVQIANLNSNFPLNSTSTQKPLFEDAAHRARMADIDQQNCKNSEQLRLDQDNGVASISQNVQNCMVLNAAGPYFDGGVVRMNTSGTFYYMSTRNNNFSNRFQKGTITVN